MKYFISTSIIVFLAFLIPTVPKYDETFDLNYFDSKPIESLSAESLVELAYMTEKDVKVAEKAPGTVVEANWYRDFIFQHESGWRLDAVNSIGCKGLGQDCNSVLEVECPDWRTSTTCQLDFWERYCMRRYGSWERAYNFWLRNSWW